MTAKDIIIKYLKENGYDGLCDGDQCGCGINDTFPCDCIDGDNCQPAYKRYCINCDFNDDCDIKEEAEGFCFHTEKQESSKTSEDLPPETDKGPS